MRAWVRVVDLVNSLFRRANVEQDLDDELRSYVELSAADKQRSGMSAEGARRAALVEVGGIEHVKEKVRIDRAGATVAMFTQDLRYAIHGMRRNPSFSAIAILCITVGVAATTTMFSAVNGILLRPLPYTAAGEFIVIRQTSVERGATRNGLSWADVVSWNNESRTVSDVGIWGLRRVRISGPDGTPEWAMAAGVSAEVLSALRINPVVGRLIRSDDQRFGNHFVVLLGHDLWQRFGGDTNMIGRSIVIGSRPYQVIGVLPQSTAFPDGAQLWTPAQIDEDEITDHEKRYYSGAIARLSDDASMDAAREEIDAISERTRTSGASATSARTTEVVPFRDYLVGNLRTPALLLQGAAILVLLIACANVANLMLARGVTRRREMGIRVALGGARSRLVRQLMTESIVLAMVGGTLGALVGRLADNLLPLAFPDGVPTYLDLTADTSVIAFSIAMSALTGVLFGVFPALRTTQVSPVEAFRDAGRGAGAGLAGSRMRGALVSAEIAMSLMLLVGASLLLRGDMTVTSEIGVDPHGMLAVSLPTPPSVEGAPREAFNARFAEGIRSVPGVTEVGWSVAEAPLSRANAYARAAVGIGGAPPDTTNDNAKAIVLEASREYFDALGVPFIAGRTFDESDRPASAEAGTFAAIVNETFATRFFGAGGTVGQRVKAAIPGAQSMGTPTFQIVGVVRDLRHERPPALVAPAIYVFVPFGMSNQRMFVRTDLANPLSIVPQINAIARRLDPALPPPAIESFDDAVARGLWRERLHQRVLGVFALVAVVLTLTGLYGVVAYSVAQRIPEFGMRVALGATGRTLTKLVVRQAAGLVSVGIVVGVVGTLATTRFLRGVLYGINPNDPLTIGCVSAMLACIAALAALVPARRAAAVDPMVALRAE